MNARFMPLIGFICISILFSSCSGTPCTIWVDSEYGNNENTGSLDSPVQTMNGALEKWKMKISDCSPIMQLAPGRYRNDQLKIDLPSLLVTSCVECPHQFYSEPSVVVEVSNTYNLAVISKGSITFSNISVIGVDPMTANVLLVLNGNATLMNVTMSNIQSTQSIVSVSVRGSLLAINSQFKNCTVTTDTLNTISVITSMPGTRMEFDSCLFQSNRLLMVKMATNGGICIVSHGFINLRNSIIQNNAVEFVSKFGTVSNMGGAVLTHSTTFISSTIFENNWLPLFDMPIKEPLSTYGGGLFVFVSDSLLVNISGATFRNNSALYGGGMAIKSTSGSLDPISGVIRNSLFKGNSGLSGSALYIQRPEDEWNISNTIFHENVIADSISTDERAATVAILGASQASIYSFEKCVFDRNKMESANSVLSSGYDTALSLYTESRLNISNCVFSNHLEPTQLQLPLIISYYISSSITISGNIFVNNSDNLISIFPGDDRSIDNTFKSMNIPSLSYDIDFNSFSQSDDDMFITHEQIDVLIERNHFDLYFSSAIRSERPKILISARSEVVMFNLNTFSSSVDPIRGSGTSNGQLIAVQGFSNHVAFISQDISNLAVPLQVYVAGIRSVEISNSSWKVPVIVQNARDFRVSRSTFSTSIAPAIRAVLVSELTIHQCFFSENVAADSGSAIKLTKTGAIITESFFLHNWSSRRGAIESDYSLSISDSTFYNNTAMLYGGAIWVSNRCFLKNSKFELNLASLGGAIYAASGSLSLSNITFIKNSASQQGGAIVTQDLVNLDISDSIFHSNTALSQGGALAMGLKSQLKAINITFIGNEVPIETPIVPDFDSTIEGNNKQLAQNNQRAKVEETQFTNILEGDDRVDGAGGAIWLVQAESLFLERCVFASGGALFGPHIGMKGWPVNMNITRTDFLNTTGYATGAISVSPVFQSNCKNDYPNTTMRVIEYCSFENLVAAEGAGIYLRPCGSDYSKAVIPLVNVTSCHFVRVLSSKGAAVYVQGPMSEYLNWTNSQIIDSVSDNGGSVLYYHMEMPTVESDDLPSGITPEGCQECYIGPGVSKPYLTSTGYILTDTGSNQYLWTVTKHPIFISWRDLYGPGHISARLRLNLEYDTNDSARVSVFSTAVLDVPVPQTAFISFNASKTYAQSPIYIGFSKELENAIRIRNEPLFSQIEVYVRVSPSSPSFSDFIRPNFTVNVQLNGCDIGNGLQAHASLENTFSCELCPVGSYNLISSGSCYLCNDPEETIQKASCVGREVTGTNGYFVGFELDLFDYFESNLIWTHTCNYKFCDEPTINNPCHDTREGYMCADCIEGKTESLFFSLCGSCDSDSSENSNYHTKSSFIAVFIMVWLVLLAVLHFATNKNFFVSLTGMLVAQQLLIYPRQYVSTVLPHGLALAIVRWMCIASSTALTRATLFATIAPIAIPIISAITLLILISIINVFKLAYHMFMRKGALKDENEDEDENPLLSDSDIIDSEIDHGNDSQNSMDIHLNSSYAINSSLSQNNRKTSSKFDPDFTSSLPYWLSFNSAFMTCWSFFIITITPVVQTLIEYEACEPASQNRLLWKVAPSVSCHDPVFIYRRRVAMGLGIPWVVFVLGATAVLSWKMSQLERLRTFAERVFMRPRWHPSISIFTVLLTNLVVGIMTSTSYWHDSIATVGVPLAFMIPVAVIMLIKPMKGTFLNGTMLNLTFLGSSASLIAVSYGNPSKSQNAFNEATQLYIAILLLVLYIIASIFPSERLKRFRECC